MKTRFFNPCLACTVLVAALANESKAETIYWHGTSSVNWSNVANWSTDPDVPTSNPLAVPGASDDVVFNITGANENQDVSLVAANRSANSMTFFSSGSTFFRRASTDSTTGNSIVLGAGGLTMTFSSGAVTVGSDQQRISLRAMGSLSLTNNSSSLLTFNRGVSSGENSGTTVITMNGSGTGGTAFADLITDGTSGANLALRIDTTDGFTYLSGGTGNTYSGGTTLEQGVLALRSSNPFGSGTLTINGGTLGSAVIGRNFGNDVTINGDFQLGGVSVPELSNQATTLNGTVDLGGAPRTITLGNSATFNGVVSNGGLVIEALSNTTLTLAGNSDYEGATQVNSGTLRIDGDNSAATGTINVAAGATLGGNGTSGGAVEISPGGSLSVRINDWTGAPGVGYDDLAVASLDAGSGEITVVVNATDMINFTEGNQSFTVLNASGDISGFNPELASVSATGFPGVGTWEFTQDGSSLVLEYTVGIVDPYLAWIGGFEVADESKLGDPENDGISNLMEFVLDGNPGISDTNILPTMGLTATDFTFTYIRREDSKDVAQVVQYGSNLSGWTDVAIPAAAGESTVGAATVTVDDGDPASGPDTVTVSIPRTVAVGDKLFARLVVGP